jgi:predicted DNA-binding protein (MmcQ/YjbR family)
VADGLDGVRKAILEHALALPGAWEDHPWGETAVKVGKKVFLFVDEDSEGRLSFSVKLPESGDAALSLGFTSPTAYGLGESGWVSSVVGPEDDAPLDVFLRWVDESYRAVAPKKLAGAIDGAPVAAKRKRANPARPR